MLGKTILGITLVSLCLLAMVFNLANPSGIGPFGVLIVLGLMYLSLFGIVTFLIYVFRQLIMSFISIFSIKSRGRPITFKRTVYYSAVISSAPVILVGLGTVNSVGIYETLLVLILVGLGCFYVARTR